MHKYVCQEVDKINNIKKARGESRDHLLKVGEIKMSKMIVKNFKLISGSKNDKGRHNKMTPSDSVDANHVLCT